MSHCQQRKKEGDLWNSLSSSTHKENESRHALLWLETGVGTATRHDNPCGFPSHPGSVRKNLAMENTVAKGLTKKVDLPAFRTGDVTSVVTAARRLLSDYLRK